MTSTKILCGLLGLLVFAASMTMTWASPPVGVTPTLIGRGTYDGFKVKSENRFFEFEAEVKPEIDMVVRTHAYLPGGSTGWHSHPGPVFITVTEGEIAFYELDDPTCTPTIVREGEGYVDTGHGHIGINHTSNPAKDVSVILAPVGRTFRDELPAGPCGF